MIKLASSVSTLVSAATFLVGVMIGLVYLGYGMLAFMVMGEKEPLVSYLALTIGLFSVLPAVLMSARWRRIGAIWLIGASIIATSLMMLLVKTPIQVFAILCRYTGPVLGVGLILLVLRETDTCPDCRAATSRFRKRVILGIPILVAVSIAHRLAVSLCLISSPAALFLFLLPAIWVIHAAWKYLTVLHHRGCPV